MRGHEHRSCLVDQAHCLDLLMRDHAVLGRLVAGEDPRRIAEDLRVAANGFIAKREKYLLY